MFDNHQGFHHLLSMIETGADREGVRRWIIYKNQEKGKSLNFILNAMKSCGRLVLQKRDHLNLKNGYYVFSVNNKI